MSCLCELSVEGASRRPTRTRASSHLLSLSPFPSPRRYSVWRPYYAAHSRLRPVRSGSSSRARFLVVTRASFLPSPYVSHPDLVQQALGLAREFSALYDYPSKVLGLLKGAARHLAAWCSPWSSRLTACVLRSRQRPPSAAWHDTVRLER